MKGSAAGVLLCVAAAVSAAYAQRGGGGGGMMGPGAVENAVMGSEGARVMTPFEQFADKLKLDEKTQLPAVREIFMAAQQEASPVGTEMLQLRQKLLNVDLGSAPDDRKAVLDAYAAAAAKMGGVESRAFAKVYDLLKPNQQGNAAQAFALLTGFFQPAGAMGGRGGRQ
jgi:hypothetical protein